MNKRIILSLLVLVCLLVSIDSFAIEANKMDGDFSILNGIKFGMNRTQIEQCMGQIATPPGSYYRNRISFKVETIGGIQIGRMNQDNLFFEFESNNLMKCTNLSFWSGYYDGQRESTERSFNALCDGISSKYGKSITPKDFHFVSESHNGSLSWLSTGGKLIGAKEWIVEYENYYVVIYATLIHLPDTSFFNISYNLVSISEMDEYYNPKTPSIDLNGL